MFKKFKKSILTALVAAIALPLILALYLILPKINTVTVQAEEVQTVSTAEELSTQLSASDTVEVQLTSDILSDTTFTVSGTKTLDLNGYVVTFTGEEGSVISVAEEADFTLKDSNPTKENTVGEKTVNGGVITGGKVIGCGGGIYVNSSAVFTMKGGNVSGNTATYDSNKYAGGGAGVYVENGSFIMEGGSISGNTSTKANYYHGGGGGVYVKGGSFTMKGGSISGNTSADAYSAAGGGVCIKNGSFIMEDGAISDNVTNDRGGGVYVENDNPSTGAGGETIFIMKGGSISGNTSAASYSGDGGGVYVTNASFTMEKGTISDNVTQTNGGGVYVVNGSFTMEDGSISGNKTTSSGSSYGGGVYVYENSTFTMNGGTLSSNEAANGGGVYVVSSGSKFKMTDSEISGNKSSSGGGIYITSGAEAEIHGGSIRDNIANGSNGGGIYISGGAISIEETEISGCEASTAGGIYVNSGATANLSKVTITGCSNTNLDENGNAISNGSAISSYGGTVRLTDGKISGNTKGAAIFWVGPEFTISGAPYIYDNEDGDLVPSGPMYTIENLEEGAKIGITGTPPTPNGVFTTGGAIDENNVKCFYSNDEKCITVINGEASVSADDHDGGEATCTAKAVCTSCGQEYGEALGHDYQEATCTEPKTCARCGEKEGEALGHDFDNGTYSSDNSQHWKTCSRCDAEDTEHKENCDGGEATCIAKAECETCGNEYGEALGHDYHEATCTEPKTCASCGEQEGEALGHDYEGEGSAYTSDGTQHWKICARCDAEDTEHKENCDGGTATCIAKAECETCGNEYGDFGAHDFTGESSTFTSDGTQHWKICARCDAEDTEHKENCNGCTATCIAKAECETCGNEYGDFGAHDWATEWTTDENQHWHVCKNEGCTQTDTKADHEYNQEIATETYLKSAATCTEKAVYYKSCVCGEHGAETFENGELVAHTPAEAVRENEVAATCSQEGSYNEVVYCSVCTHKISSTPKTIEKIAHTEEVIPAKAATCTAKGKTEGKKCSVCGEIIVAQTETDMIAHTEVTDSAVAPTCTESGKTAGKHCSVCNTVIEAQTTVEALGHTEETDSAVAPTCTESGKTAGKHCSVCGTVIEAQATVEALGHNYGEWTVVKEATETEEGEERRVCANDNTHYESRALPKLTAPDNNGGDEVENKPQNGLSAGAIAGIVVACILLALLIIYIVCYFALYRRDIILKGKFFDAIYVPMNAIFGKKEQDNETENS